jgi:zinc/manganese transport system substrate-binding protein
MVRTHSEAKEYTMNLHSLKAAIALATLLVVALPARAALDVFACEPEWASLTQELGGDHVSVSSATTAAQDPHHIQARPSLIARMRRADLVVCTGMELEIGWLPVLIGQSGNPRLVTGSPALFEAGRYITPLEVPARVDRSEGDVHADGNPHIQLDPRNIALVAQALEARLAQIDPGNAADYAARLRDFSARWSAAIQRWQQQAQPLRGMAVVDHHRNMSYLWHWLGVHEVGTLEPKPGVEPSAGHLAELAAQLKREPARMVVRAAYQDARASQWLSGHAGIPAVELPFTVGGDARAADLYGLFDDTIARLLEAAK